MSDTECEVPPVKRLKSEDGLEEAPRSEKLSHLSKYDNYVTQEELEKLKEFQVLDEVKSNDEDSNEEDSDSSDGKSEGLPEDEIEKMLEEDLPDGFKGVPKQKERPYITRQKIVLEEKGVNYFEVLPLDWMMVRHYSGMPVYMHRTTRVCTLSKPYFLGKGNTRRHDIPISSIPCLAYRRALEEEAKQKEIDRKIEEQIRNGTWATKTQTTDKKPAPTENSLSVNVDKTRETERATGVALKCPFRRNASETEVLPSGPNNVYEKDDKEKVQNLDEANETSKNDVFENSNAIENVDKNTNNVVQNDVAESSEAKVEAEDAVANCKEEMGETKDEVENAIQGEEATKDVEVPLNRQPVVLPGGIVMPPPRVETVNTSWKTQHLTHEQVNGYCKKLFKFKTVNIMHFKRWADRRKYTKARKTLQYPTLPEGTKLITIPAQTTAGSENGGKSNKRDWVMNMNGRSYLSVFHEYVRRALQKQPVYEFVQLENASAPYQATVYIGGMQYGVGHGSSKRQAKSAAARASIHILIPEMKDELDAHAPAQAHADNHDTDFSVRPASGDAFRRALDYYINTS